MSPGDDQYELLDSGQGEKLERFGDYVLRRPSPQALWKPELGPSTWSEATAHFVRRDKGGGEWVHGDRLPEFWKCRLAGIDFRISPTNFGHLGAFPEQRPFWKWIRARCQAESESRGRSLRLLNLFAYTGGSSLAAAQGHAMVTHCDASKGIVRWASQNAEDCAFERGEIRWIIDDAPKFLAREARRNSFYDAIVLDPPSFGRGPKGQVWKLEESITELLDACAAVLSDEAAFVLLSAHTPGLGPLAFRTLLRQSLREHPVAGTSGSLAHGEMYLAGGPGVNPLPNGTWCSWSLGSAPETEVPS